MLKVLLPIFALTSLPALAASFDPPDLTFEANLHRVYLQSLGQAPSASPQPVEGWIENYRLQKGENLWTLSQMLYGDGAYWPKVWAQNRDITNPHLVRPGIKLELLLGSEDQAPAFRFSEAGDAGPELAAASVSGNPAAIELPPPEVAPRPVIKIPPSFPAWQEMRHKKEKITDFSQLRENNIKVPDKMTLNGYVQDGPIEPQGAFLETEAESGLPVANEYVYVKVKKGVGRVGDKMLIVHDEGQVMKLNDQVEGSIKAHKIEVNGDIQLTDASDAKLKSRSDREDYEVFRAIILHSTGLSLTNNALIPGEVQVVDLKPEGPTADVHAQIIGSTKLTTSALYGPGDIVFLNRGSKDGVVAGQILEMHMDRSIRDATTAVVFSGKSSGRMKVVRVDNGCATAVILDSIDAILQGDHAEQNVSRSEQAPEAEAPATSDSSSDFDSGEDLPDQAPASSSDDAL